MSTRLQSGCAALAFMLWACTSASTAFTPFADVDAGPDAGEPPGVEGDATVPEPERDAAQPERDAGRPDHDAAPEPSPDEDAGPCAEQGGDSDFDGVCGFVDNCPAVPNPPQVDTDDDGVGNACDPVEARAECAGRGGDADGDEICEAEDNCPGTANADQRDADDDGYGDACDPLLDACFRDGGDSDDDGLCDRDDNCPRVANEEQLDADADGVGDACDPLQGSDVCAGRGGDADQDGVCQAFDNCPAIANAAQTDTDRDGVGNACDATPNRCDDQGGDSDADGVCSAVDNCPNAPNAGQRDADWDGIGDICDSYVAPNPDGDPCAGLGDDNDHDGWCGVYDNCVTVTNYDQSDLDNDGIGDVCDVEDCNGKDETGEGDIDEGYPDEDGDGQADCVDPCPKDATNDGDGDGLCAPNDNCPDVPNANYPGNADLDKDGKGAACDPEVCNGQDDDADYTIDEDSTDADGDGRCDERDACPNDLLDDIDGDGRCGDVDNCPTIANATQTDTNHDGQGDECETKPLVGHWTTQAGNVARTRHLAGEILKPDFRFSWRAPMAVSSGSSYSASDIASNGDVVLVNVGGSVRALEVTDGTTRWTYTGATAPSLVDGQAFTITAPNSNNQAFLSVLDPASGFVTRSATVSASYVRGISPVVVFDDRIALGTSDYGVMVALDRSGLTTAWSTPSTGSYDSGIAYPSAAGGVVYTILGNVVAGRSAATGTAVGSVVLPVPPASWTQLNQSPAIGATNIHAWAQGNVYAVSKTTWQVVWNAGGINAAPAVVGDTVLLVSNKALEARSEADGALLWRWHGATGADDVNGPIVATDDYAIVSTSVGVYAVRLADQTASLITTSQGALMLDESGLYVAVAGSYSTPAALERYALHP